MKITILDQKYKVGCGRGMNAFQRPGLLTKLNSIIEWDKCEWPKKKDKSGEEVEDRDFLGPDPELKPGNCFFFNGQVIAIEDQDTVVLIISETGTFALERIFDEVIKLEFDLFFNYSGKVNNVVFEDTDSGNIPESYSTYDVPYPLMKIFREKYISGRYSESGICIKAQVDSDNYLFPPTVYILDWKLRYDPDEIEEERINYAAKELFAWFYNKFDRIVPKKEEEKK